MVCNCNVSCQPRLHTGMAANNFHSCSCSQHSQDSSFSVTNKLNASQDFKDEQCRKIESVLQMMCLDEEQFQQPARSLAVGSPLPPAVGATFPHQHTKGLLLALSDPFNIALMFQDRHLFLFHSWLGFVFLNCTKCFPLLDCKEIAHSLFFHQILLFAFFQNLAVRILLQIFSIFSLSLEKA